METELKKHQRVTAMAAQYEQALQEILEASELINKANNRLKLEFGDHCHTHIDVEYGLRKSPAEIKQRAWRYILEQSQVRSFLSLKRQKELETQINDNKLPEITKNNILSTLHSFLGDSSTLLTETVKEVFDWLRPWRDDYKTNKKFRIGPKVIKEWMVDPSYGHRFNIRYGNENVLTALDNAFHLLDGQGVRRHPEKLVTAITTAMKNEQNIYKDDMFKCKWYQKGTLHIEFKRLDLLKQLNRIGSGGKAEVGDKEYSRNNARQAVARVQ